MSYAFRLCGVFALCFIKLPPIRLAAYPDTAFLFVAGLPSSWARWRELNPLTGELSTFCAIRFAPITLLPFRAYRLGRLGRANGLPESFPVGFLLLVLANLVVGAAGFEPANVQISGSYPPRPTLLRRLCVAEAFNSFRTVCRLAVGIRRSPYLSL